MKYTVYLFLLLLLPLLLFAEDGSRLWLRYKPLTEVQKEKGNTFSSIVKDEKSATLDIASRELSSAWKEIAGKDISSATLQDGSIVLGTTNSKNVRSLLTGKELKDLTDDGFIIRSVKKGNRNYTVITSAEERGILYGVFHFLRLIQTDSLSDNLNIVENPKYKVRILNHWDNLDRTVERGYAGYSLWKWDELPNTLSPRYEAYARANASIGINATVLNNVNATPEILTGAYLAKVKALADVFRPYGLKVY
ncbi:MAG: alpha-glucuronidase, partial [Prevotella sp.]|nr:alpha-glucuronidase [Prevotella sp.]